MQYICKPARVSIYNNTTGKTAAQVKAETGCNALINGGYFNKYFKATGNLKIDGVEIIREWISSIGYEWSGNELPRYGWSEMKTKDNFIGCVPLVENGKAVTPLKYPAETGYSCPRTAFGTFADGRVWMYASKANMEPEELQVVAVNAGVQDAIMLDSGGSTQGISPDETVASTRPVVNFVCVWAEGNKEANKPMAKHKVCIDAGHGGNDKSNGSPDGLFKEYKFTLDIALRIKAYLENAGIDVVLTRDEDESVSLANRAKIANDAKTDLFVSVHSNASGNSGWTEPSGLCVYTYGAGESLARNVLARNIIEAMKADNIKLFGSELYHAKFAVLAQTNMAAVLIEYGFHTNREETELLKNDDYRERLAYNTAKGICKHLGVTVPEKTNKDKQETNKALEWAKARGIAADGENLDAPVTKAELIAALYMLNNG